MSADDPAEDGSLVADLESDDVDRQRAALERLIAAPRPLSAPLVSALVRCVGAVPKAVQRRAADALRSCDAGGRPDVVAALRQAVNEGDPRRRWGATFALAQLGLVDPSLVTALVEAMASPDGDQRWAAASIIISCGRASPDEVVPALLASLGSGSAPLRKMTLYVLRDLAPGTADVAAAVIDALRDPDVGVRLAALSGLCRLDPIPQTACDLVLAMLRDDPDPGLRRAATTALGDVGRGVDAVRAVLAVAVESDDAGLRRAAEVARRRLDAPPPARR